MRPLTVLALALVVAFAGCATGTTGSPTTVSTTEATIAGNVASTTGGQVEYWVQFGPTTAYGSESAHQTVTAQQNQVLPVSVLIAGLAAGTSYHYRLCASDSQQQGGPGCGEDRRLTTQAVDCGTVVTTDLTLTGNLSCPQQPGLIVGANGVEINLGGHVLDGAVAVGGGGPAGIDNSGGFDDLTVRNGTVTLFGDAIEIADGDRNRVVNVTAGGANTGIRIQGGSDDEIRNSDVFGRAVGIAVLGSDELLVANSEVSAAFSSAITVRGDFARIDSNRAVHPPGSLIGSPAIALVGSNGRVSRNHVEGSWISGISVSGSDDVIADNDVSGAAAPGVQNPAASYGDGIFVSGFAARTRLVRNSSHDNADDGIQTQDSTSRLGSNVANDNGDLGIDAAAGVTDLGFNSAFGNGNPLQCRNVFCS